MLEIHHSGPEPSHCIYVSALHLSVNILGFPDQNGVSLLYTMLEIYLSGREPSHCIHVSAA